MVPPSQPFVQTVETIFNLFLYLSLAWAWCSVATKIAHSVRVPTNPDIIAAAMERHKDLGPYYQNQRVVRPLYLGEVLTSGQRCDLPSGATCSGVCCLPQLRYSTCGEWA